MARTKYQLPITLDPEDAKILEAVVAVTGESRSAVLRWALRHYSLRGPWARTKARTHRGYRWPRARRCWSHFRGGT